MEASLISSPLKHNPETIAEKNKLKTSKISFLSLDFKRTIEGYA